ncbi:MAG: hypothetical protein Q7K57_44385 [Burkholderiaceae bacterium]|nr:hypothetical protein [Burkholderiaceae bacterium]
MKHKECQRSLCADNCNIFVRNQRAGQRIMQNVMRYLRDSLRLTVNANESAVDLSANRKFLGFTVSKRGARIKVADKHTQQSRVILKRLEPSSWVACPLIDF